MCVGGIMATLSDLPDLVLLEIFSYLPVRDRIRVSRVCHRWKRLVNDGWLWRHIDLSVYTVRPKVIWHLLHRYMTPRLHSLHLGGYLLSGSQAPQLSPALMNALGQKCPNLKRLCLHVANLSMVPVTSLPCTLRTLELHSCEISMGWLLEGQDPPVLPLLECMVLSRVPAFRDEHLQGLTRFRALRSLVLGGTYRVTETGLDASLQELSYLQRLEVLGCTPSADSTLLAISRHLRDVRKIRVTIRGLSAPGLSVLEGMPALESLCLQGLHVTPEMPSPAEIISSCLTMPKLRVLELQGLEWGGQEAVRTLRKGLPHCLVIVRACPKESVDWWM
ncbi:F-box/LRR-repeat protein 12 [Pteronotus mesoamericanus]|uniref:F-box/LRR-repeat protein 12 n=1 Tax=Pteronotus mesoamericanus TaxID=1884717 RepID=UPI0023EB9772|nr:F-box/LRR-repeat protein 12 [Pteronotus parnellii mesoamericanus]